MKSLFKLASLLFVCAFVMSSCEKEEEINAPDSLVGTSWLCDAGSEVVDGVEVSAAIEIDFTTATAGKINLLVGGKSATETTIAGFEAGDFSYTYSKPTVKITVDGETETGKIDGNKLTIGKMVFEKE
jgi:hypothetical protein